MHEGIDRYLRLIVPSEVLIDYCSLASAIRPRRGFALVVSPKELRRFVLTGGTHEQKF